MKYLALSLLLALVLVLGLNGAPQAGFGQYGSQLDSGILNFGAIDSGIYDVQTFRNDELAWTVPAGRDFVLLNAWWTSYGWPADAYLKVRRATTGATTTIVNWSSSRVVDWSCSGFRLYEGDQLWVQGHDSPNFGWSGFYIKP